MHSCCTNYYSSHINWKGLLASDRLIKQSQTHYRKKKWCLNIFQNIRSTTLKRETADLRWNWFSFGVYYLPVSSRLSTNFFWIERTNQVGLIFYHFPIIYVFLGPNQKLTPLCNMSYPWESVTLGWSIKWWKNKNLILYFLICDRILLMSINYLPYFVTVITET